jgi:hypothetical protein
MSPKARVNRLLRQARADWLAAGSDEEDDRFLEEELRRRLGPGATVEQKLAEVERMEAELREEEARRFRRP